MPQILIFCTSVNLLGFNVCIIALLIALPGCSANPVPTATMGALLENNPNIPEVCRSTGPQKCSLITFLTFKRNFQIAWY